MPTKPSLASQKLSDEESGPAPGSKAWFEMKQKRSFEGPSPEEKTKDSIAKIDQGMTVQEAEVYAMVKKKHPEITPEEFLTEARKAQPE